MGTVKVLRGSIAAWIYAVFTRRQSLSEFAQHELQVAGLSIKYDGAALTGRLG